MPAGLDPAAAVAEPPPAAAALCWGGWLLDPDARPGTLVGPALHNKTDGTAVSMTKHGGPIMQGNHPSQTLRLSRHQRPWHSADNISTYGRVWCKIERLNTARGCRHRLGVRGEQHLPPRRRAPIRPRGAAPPCAGTPAGPPPRCTGACSCSRTSPPGQCAAAPPARRQPRCAPSPARSPACEASLQPVASWASVRGDVQPQCR